MPLCPFMKITAFVPGLDFGLSVDAIIVLIGFLCELDRNENLKAIEYLYSDD